VLVATATIGATTPGLAQQPQAGAPATQTASRSYSIAAGPLTRALEEFSRRTGVAVIDPQALAEGVETRGLSGEYTDQEALRRLLEGTGLTYRYTSARQIRLERGDVGGMGDGPVEIAGVTVTGLRQTMSSPKYTAPLRDVPQTISVIPAEVIEAQGVTALRDVVRNVPGLTVNAGEGGATPGDNFNIRGFSARSDLFVNGVRDLGGYSRETFNIEQVEVTKGPGSVYSGRGSTGGSVNLVTKTPTTGSEFYAATVGVGNADFTRAAVDLNQPLEGLSLRGLGVRMNASWQNAGIAGLDVVKNRSWGVAPSVAFEPNADTRLTVDYSHVQQENIPAYGMQNNETDGPLTGSNPRAFYGLRSLDREDVSASTLTGRVERYLGDQFSLRTQVGYIGTDVDRIVTFGQTNGTRSSRSHITSDQNVTGAVDLTGRFDTGSVGHTAVAGVEIIREESSRATYEFTAPPPPIEDLANPNPDAPYAGEAIRRRPSRQVEATTSSAYIFDTVRLSPALELNGGLRYDHFSPVYRDSLDVIQEPRTTADALTWRAGAVVKPAPYGSIYFSYGTSFNPSGETLALSGDGASGVQPEKNRSFEVGTKWDLLDERLSLTGAVFRTEKTNARMDDPDDPLGEAIILAGRQRAQGFEAGISGRPVPGWVVIGAYTFMESEILTGNEGTVGNPLPNTPKHAASLWTTYLFPWRLEVGGGVRFVDERWLRPTSTVPSYTAFDAEAAYVVNENLTLRLNLQNLTDATYFDQGRFWVPAAGRSAKFFAAVRY